MNVYYNTNEYLEKLKKYWTDSASESNLSEYIDTDVAATNELWLKANPNLGKPEIEKVIFNKPATIVIWKDKTKTVVKCGENDIYDPEKGLAMCYVKKILGNKGIYYNVFKKWLPKEEGVTV